MRKYYKIKLTIIEENQETNYKSLKVSNEEIIVKRTIMNEDFKEIVTGLTFSKEYEIRNGVHEKVTLDSITWDYENNPNKPRTYAIKEQGFYVLVEDKYFNHDNPIAKYDDIYDYIENFDDSKVSKYLKQLIYEKDEQKRIKKYMKRKNLK